MGSHYDWDLDIQLETKVQEYEEARQRYWKDLGLSAKEYDQAERLAKAVFKNSEQLTAIEEIDGDLSKLQSEINKFNRRSELDQKFAEIATSDLPSDKKTALICDVLKDYPPDPRSEDSPLKLVWERFAIDLSWEAIGKTTEGAARIFRLYNLILSSKPSKPTQQFLGRLSRCFIWGFDPECVILCRAVIDTAFRDSISPQICEKHVGRRRDYSFTLNDRIRAARNEKIIDEDIAKKARNVKERGNKAVHTQPGLTTDIWGTICDTVAVLERITKAK